MIGVGRNWRDYLDERHALRTLSIGRGPRLNLMVGAEAQEKRRIELARRDAKRAEYVAGLKARAAKKAADPHGMR